MFIRYQCIEVVFLFWLCSVKDSVISVVDFFPSTSSSIPKRGLSEKSTHMKLWFRSHWWLSVVVDVFVAILLMVTVTSVEEPFPLKGSKIPEVNFNLLDKGFCIVDDVWFKKNWKIKVGQF